ncbi:hypothetical protein SK3146_04791 [Paenibacillus konkukensis]|uniref:DUF4305 domain-containing protein n=2 Tax=Paenibacillus konkukensis TaxID=2020716 RepID=A0ABY4RU28_9BACL|nr:hypothetical protein SK3146_04791 [Paenibacillus konkukensis]
MADWIRSISLWLAFIVLMVLHGALYYSMGTTSWFWVTLMASAVDTAVLAVIQFLLAARDKQREH